MEEKKIKSLNNNVKKLFKKRKEMTNEELLELQKKYQEVSLKNKKDIELLNQKISKIRKSEKAVQNELDLLAYELENRELKEYKKLEEIEESVEAPNSSLEIYLCFKKVDEENYEVYAVSSENELMTKEVIPIKYENISAPIRELGCFVEYLKYITNLQKIKDLGLVKVSKLYVDNLYIVNNWTNGVVKENQNEVIKELIPIATALRKEFEDLGGELVYVKPKENTARIYYKENIEE